VANPTGDQGKDKTMKPHMTAFNLSLGLSLHPSKTSQDFSEGFRTHHPAGHPAGLCPRSSLCSEFTENKN
jgi:hypothetical protein